MGAFPILVRSVPTYGTGAASVELPRVRRRSFYPGTRPIARAQGALGIGAAAIGLIGVALPHPSGFDELGLIAIQAVSLGTGLVLFFGAGHIAPWVLRAMPFTAIALTSLAIYFTRDSTSAYALFYLWPSLYAFYFLSRTEVALTIAFAVTNYAVTIAIVGDPPAGQANSELHHLVVLAGTLVVAGSLLLYLRERVQRLMGRLSEAARTDLLTDLPNSRALHDALTTEIERARPSGAQVSVLILDLDRFRSVNEALGHRVGDELLRRLGEVLVDATRRMETVARTGPAEFTIVMPDSPGSSAYLLGEQLLARVRRGFRDEFAPLTASVGIAAYPEHAATSEELIKVAERSLQAAKLLGRDRAVLFSPEVQDVLSGTIRRPSNPASHLTTMVSLAEAIDLRDSGTAEHSKRVGRFAEQIAEELGLNEYRVERVRLAGLLHDIGKIGVPDAVLCKAGPLDEGDWEEMRKHPEIGSRILGSRELVDIREWVLASHERPDGAGYPRGLSDGEIPLEAKILAVADAYEAMTGDRLYRPAIGEAAAREELRASAGTQFDREVVNALVSVLDRQPEQSSAP